MERQLLETGEMDVEILRMMLLQTKDEKQCFTEKTLAKWGSYFKNRHFTQGQMLVEVYTHRKERWRERWACVVAP